MATTPSDARTILRWLECVDESQPDMLPPRQFVRIFLDMANWAEYLQSDFRFFRDVSTQEITPMRTFVLAAIVATASCLVLVEDASAFGRRNRCSTCCPPPCCCHQPRCIVECCGCVYVLCPGQCICCCGVQICCNACRAPGCSVTCGNDSYDLNHGDCIPCGPARICCR